MWFIILALSLVGPVFAGEPILPEDALKPIVATASEGAILRSELARIAAARWVENEAPEEPEIHTLTRLASGNSSTIRAFLIQPPVLSGGVLPSSCQLVRAELEKSRVSLERMHQYRDAIDQALRRIARYFKAGSERQALRELTRVDTWILEVNQLLDWLNKYRIARDTAPRDIAVEYLLSMRGPRANELRWSGYSALENPDIIGLSFGDRNWMPMDAVIYRDSLFFDGPPEPKPEGKWQIKRLLSQAKYCELGSSPQVKVRAIFTKEGAEPRMEDVELNLRRAPLF